MFDAILHRFEDTSQDLRSDAFACPAWVGGGYLYQYDRREKVFSLLGI